MPIKYSNDLTQEYLKSILEYNPETGLFIWLKQVSNRIKSGSTAGTIRSDGYVKIIINRKIYFAHRLAWLYMTGKWPEDLVDHKDNIKHNNIWENLREANHSQNNKNRAAYGTTDKNIYPYRGKFVVRVCLGTYNTKEEAITVRDKFLKEFEFENDFIHSSLKVEK